MMTHIHRDHIYMMIILFLTVLLVLFSRQLSGTAYSDEVPRVAVEEARLRVLAGESLLICGYEGHEKFRSIALEGAISLNSFREIAETIPRDKELIFY